MQLEAAKAGVEQRLAEVQRYAQQVEEQCGIERRRAEGAERLLREERRLRETEVAAAVVRILRDTA